MIGDNTWVYWRFRNGHENLGAFGESVWANAITQSGLFYIQLSTLPALNRRGPRLQGNDAILPDFHVSGRRNAYIDSKCKTKPIRFRKANELRHGIDKKDRENYEAISGINRQKCLIGVLELFCENETDWSGALLLQSLSKLGKPIAGFSNQAHMCYWPRAAFEQVGRLHPQELWQLARGEFQLSDSTKAAIDGVLEHKPAIQGMIF
jgi:hypothetical protein